MKSVELHAKRIAAHGGLGDGCSKPRGIHIDRLRAALLRGKVLGFVETDFGLICFAMVHLCWEICR